MKKGKNKEIKYISENVIENFIMNEDYSAVRNFGRNLNDTLNKGINYALGTDEINRKQLEREHEINNQLRANIPNTKITDDILNSVRSHAVGTGIDGTTAGLKLGAAGTVAAGGLLVGAAGAAYIIKKAYQNYKYRKTQCNNLIDPIKINRCKLYLRKKELSALKSSLGKCKDDTCRNNIMKRIQDVQNKIVQ